MDSSPTDKSLLEGKVKFHDRSHLKIAETKQNGDSIADIKMKEGFTSCFIRLEKNELSFLASATDEKAFCSFNPTHMSIEIDRNAQ